MELLKTNWLNLALDLPRYSQLKRSQAPIALQKPDDQPWSLPASFQTFQAACWQSVHTLLSVYRRMPTVSMLCKQECNWTSRLGSGDCRFEKPHPLAGCPVCLDYIFACTSSSQFMPPFPGHQYDNTKYFAAATLHQMDQTGSYVGFLAAIDFSNCRLGNTPHLNVKHSVLELTVSFAYLSAWLQTHLHSLHDWLKTGW